MIRKLIKFIFSLIGIIVGLVLVGAIVLAVVIYDGTNNIPEYVSNDPWTLEQRVANNVGVSMVDTKETNTIDMTLSEKDVNYLANSIIKQNIDINGQVTILGAYVDVTNENSATFYVPCKAGFYKTMVSAKLTIEHKNDGVFIQLNDVSLGKLKVVSAFTKSIFKKFVTKDSLEKSLKDAGIEATVDMDEFKVFISNAAIKNVVLDALKDDPDIDLYSPLVNELLSNSTIVKIVFGKEEKIGAQVNINSLSYQSTIDGESTIEYDFNTIAIKTATVINANNNSYTYANEIFKFLSKGYDSLEDKEKAIIDNLDFTGVGITNKSTYQGYAYNEKRDISDSLKTQVPGSVLELATLSLKVDEVELNKILASMDILGTGFAFPYYEESTYKVAYIVIDSFFVDILDDSLQIKLTMDINGKKIVFKMTFIGEETAGLKVTLDFDTLNFGSIVVTEHNKQSFFTYVSKALSSEKWIKCNTSTQQIVLDFTDIFADNTILSAILDHVTVKTSLHGVNLDSDGYILISKNTIIG